MRIVLNFWFFKVGFTFGYRAPWNGWFGGFSVPGRVNWRDFTFPPMAKTRARLPFGGFNAQIWWRRRRNGKLVWP